MGEQPVAEHPELQRVEEPVHLLAVPLAEPQVVRGDDLLPSTAAQSLLCDLLGIERPEWVHVPLVLGPDGDRGVVAECSRGQCQPDGRQDGFSCMAGGVLYDAAAGDQLTVTGSSFRVARSGQADPGAVVLRWNGVEGTELASVLPDRAGNISATFAIPEGQPGYYVIVATQKDAKGVDAYGTPARASFQILGANGQSVVTPAVSSAGSTVASSPSSSGIIALTVGLGALGLALFGAGFVAFVRQARRYLERLADRDSCPAVAWLALGRISLDDDDPDKAIAYFKRVAEREEEVGAVVGSGDVAGGSVVTGGTRRLTVHCGQHRCTQSPSATSSSGATSPSTRSAT